MDCEQEREPDPMAAERRWQRYLADVDAEIREEQSVEYQAERAAEATRRECLASGTSCLSWTT